jgi:8-oxo-dGTP diphosphatase
MKAPKAAIAIIKEATRHLLRRPVVGVVAIAHTRDGRCLLIRRRDTGEWALPGGTVEWGETLDSCIRRELLEEAGVEVLHLGELAGCYSHPDRDWRFHAVTIVVKAEVSPPIQPPQNKLEIADVGLFDADSLPEQLSHEMGDMLRNALEGKVVWE